MNSSGKLKMDTRGRLARIADAHWLLLGRWLLGWAIAAGAQNNPVWLPGQSTPHLSGSPGVSSPEFDEATAFSEHGRLRALNAERQKNMVSDAYKLLRLVNELNTEIAGGNEAALTPAQLRKLTEIEKLARSVKDKMSTSLISAPVFKPPLAIGH